MRRRRRSAMREAQCIVFGPQKSMQATSSWNSALLPRSTRRLDRRANLHRRRGNAFVPPPSLRFEPRLQQAEQLHKPTTRRRVNDRPRSLRQFRRRLRAQTFLVHEKGDACRARAVRTGEAVDQNLQSGGGESAVSERQQTEGCWGSYPAAGGNSATDEAHRRRKELARPSACADQNLKLRRRAETSHDGLGRVPSVALGSAAAWSWLRR